MQEQDRRDRSGDIGRIGKARRRISAARGELQGLKFDGSMAVRRSGSEPLERMLSGDWLEDHFPDEPKHPEDPGPEDRHSFILYRAPKIVPALLQDIETWLASAARSLKLPGGQRPLKYRRQFILRLADFWHEFGKSVVSTPESEFHVFCDYIFEVVGWPRHGLANAISDAVSDWLYSREKRSRLSK